MSLSMSKNCMPECVEILFQLPPSPNRSKGTLIMTTMLGCFKRRLEVQLRYLPTRQSCYYKVLYFSNTPNTGLFSSLQANGFTTCSNDTKIIQVYDVTEQMLTELISYVPYNRTECQQCNTETE